MIIRIKMKMKNISYGYDIIRPRCRRGYNYSKHKKCLCMMMLMRIEKHLSNVWRSVHGNVKQDWNWVEKRVAYKKSVYFINKIIQRSLPCITRQKLLQWILHLTKSFHTDQSDSRTQWNIPQKLIVAYFPQYS